MKKLLTLLFALILYVPVYANTYEIFNEEHSQEESVDYFSFEFLSGVTKDTESTFDSSRVLIGSALEDTSVSIYQYAYNTESECFEVIDSYEDLTIGQVGVFTQSVELIEGGNYFKIVLSKDDLTFTKTALITRKPLEVKNELEKGIILPTKKAKD